MNKAQLLNQSVAIFDAQGHLVDWNAGFVEEFADAVAILSHGVSAHDIHTACLLPERALDLTWVTHGVPPLDFEYINHRRSIQVSQHLGVNGGVFRIAQSTHVTPPLHPGMLDENAELLRSAALQISAAVLKRREQENLRLHELALKDGLTGIANRRYFDELLDIEWQRCKESQQPLSAIFIDIDFFKAYNDFYGHLRGDACLKAIASTLKEHLHRTRDVVARYGGEEFTCLLPETDLAGASQKADELEQAIRALAIPHEKSGAMPIVTISLGVATAQGITQGDASLLIKTADHLLYQAKAAGRGCVRSALCAPTG